MLLYTKVRVMPITYTDEHSPLVDSSVKFTESLCPVLFECFCNIRIQVVLKLKILHEHRKHL